MACSEELWIAGKPRPTTCTECGLGPCKSTVTVNIGLDVLHAMSTVTAGLAAWTPDKSTTTTASAAAGCVVELSKRGSEQPPGATLEVSRLGPITLTKTEAEEVILGLMQNRRITLTPVDSAHHAAQKLRARHAGSFQSSLRIKDGRLQQLITDEGVRFWDYVPTVSPNEPD
jgi:hypothetical protein